MSRTYFIFNFLDSISLYTKKALVTYLEEHVYFFSTLYIFLFNAVSDLIPRLETRNCIYLSPNLSKNHLSLSGFLTNCLENEGFDFFDHISPIPRFDFNGDGHLIYFLKDGCGVRENRKLEDILACILII